MFAKLKAVPLRLVLPWVGLFLVGFMLFLISNFPTDRVVARLLQNQKLPFEVATVATDADGFVVLKGVRLKGLPITIPTVAVDPKVSHLFMGRLAGDMRVEFAGGTLNGTASHSLITGLTHTDVTFKGIELGELPLPDGLVIWTYVERLGGQVNGWFKGVSDGKNMANVKLDGKLETTPISASLPGMKDAVRLDDLHTGIHLTAGVLSIDLNGGTGLRLSNKVYIDENNIRNSRIEGFGTIGFEFLPPAWRQDFTLGGTLGSLKINP